MTLTLIAADSPTPAFGALFTKSAFPGAPVLVGRQRLHERELSAILVNNKVSNVCAPDGQQASESLCVAVGQALKIPASRVLPCSTGVIGWRLPVEAMISAVPSVVSALATGSVLPAADGIVTTDLFAKVRRVAVGEGSVVGIAKGAGMIEPNLATMLVFLLTDLAVEREVLRESLRRACDATFGCMSVDSDTSTSDTVAVLSSGKVKASAAQLEAALTSVCADLTEDIVRNGEGVHHVLRVRVTGAPTQAIARGVGKSIVNSPLFQCAVNGNDPNVGRLVMAIGKYLGERDVPVDPARCVLSMGQETLFEQGAFRLDAAKEERLVAHLKQAELYASVPPADGLTFRPPVTYPPHERCVELEVDLGLGREKAVLLGADRSHEYISENADYRS
jgi:glutamate N-acetyltransferase / amino-acid N-acetyltransferase